MDLPPPLDDGVVHGSDVAIGNPGNAPSVTNGDALAGVIVPPNERAEDAKSIQAAFQAGVQEQR